MSAYKVHWCLAVIIKIVCIYPNGAISQVATDNPVSEPEPEPEPEPTMIPEPENPYGEPENTSPEPKADQPFAEPVPEWDKAFPMWKAAWEIHIYGMGILFALLAIYSLISIIRLRKKRLLSRGYFVALNLMMLTMGVDRAVYLLVDAYNHKLIWPSPVAYLLIGLGFPCLTSAFSILYLALLQSTQTRLVPPKIQQPKFLAMVIVIHFTVSLAADVIVGSVGNAQALLLVCQGAFLIWGISLSISYLVIFRRLYKSSVRQFREVTRLSISRRSIHMKGVAPFMKKPQNRWGNAIKVTLVTAFMGLVIAALQIYGASVVYGPFAAGIPEAWPWWSYQFIFRVCEFIMCALMSFVATQPFRYTSDGKEKPCTVPLVGFLRMLCCSCNKADHEINDDGEDEMWNNTNMFESAQLDSEGNPINFNAVSVGLDPLEAGTLTVNGTDKPKTEDFTHSPPGSPDSVSPIMDLEYCHNQNANNEKQKRINEPTERQTSSTDKLPSNGHKEINPNTNNSAESSPVRQERPMNRAVDTSDVSDKLLSSDVERHEENPNNADIADESTLNLLMGDTTTGNTDA
ncbi:uncharacterized protein [Amphiura filiformis]|uniref:uncharacterized protein n=1 Tax=Amphiura filiformis TaxID=82378 RepID=UPI003B21CF0A